MPIILCVETATEVCSACVYKNDLVLAQQTLPNGNLHANMLTTLIAQVCAEASVSLSVIDAIAVSMGPGSYTGLRVGVATVKGICVALNKPLIAVSTLKSLAQQYLLNNPSYVGLICPMIDARRMEVYTALYNEQLEEIMPANAKIITTNSFAEQLTQHNIVFIGNGALKCKEVLDFELAIFETKTLCASISLGPIALKHYQLNKFENIAYFEPYYLKEFVGTTPKNKLSNA